MANMKAKATNQIKANTNTKTAAPKASTAPKAKANVAAGNKPADKAGAPVKANREVINKATVNPVAPQPANKNAKPSAPPKASTKTATTIKISTGNDKLDKDNGVGQVETLPEDFRTIDTHKRLEKINGAEADVEMNWKALAKFYGFSVKPIMAELVAAGKWPTKDKTNKKGEVIKDASGQPVKLPMPYKAVYDEEKESNLKAVGYMVNRAANRFAAYKPKELRRATGSGGARVGAGAKRRKSSLELACEYVAGLTDKEIKSFLADELVNGALAPYLKAEHVIKAKAA